MAWIVLLAMLTRLPPRFLQSAFAENVNTYIFIIVFFVLANA